MSTDRQLTAVLGAYQNLPDPIYTLKILGSTISLLTTLTNPLNISLLTSQLLVAPAIWESPTLDLSICHRITSVYNSSAIQLLKQSQSNDSNLLGYPRRGGGVGPDAWARSVVKGADDKSSRWKHVLVIGGVLLGMESQGRSGLSQGLRASLEEALVMAANLAMEQPQDGFVLGLEATLLSLSYTFDLLSEQAKRQIRLDLLSPIAIGAMFGPSGYEMGQFVGAINTDVQVSPTDKLDWSQKSRSFIHLKSVLSRPLVSSMGPFAKLVAYTVEHLRVPIPEILQLSEQLQRFSQELLIQWRQNKLSEVDPNDFEARLMPETSRITFPQLFQALKSIMFAVVIVLRAVVGRILVDPTLANDIHAPSLAASSLHTLRNAYFISSRLGTSNFSSYSFVFLTSIDIICRYPAQSKIFLESIRPSHPGTIPTHPLDRTLDLFFLNAAEHFPLVLSPPDNESLILAAATPYINAGTHKNLLEHFEAAHSATLVSLSAPLNAQLAARMIPFYTDALFASFPRNLSPRQFCYAFKTLLQITSPPCPIAANHPHLPDTMLEVLRNRAEHASTTPLPSSVPLEATSPDVMVAPEVPLSEQAALTLTLIDALSTLAPRALSEWLPLAAELVNMIHEAEMRQVCQMRFWEVLESGEMDIDRSAVCVEWWTTRGGREMVTEGARLKDIRGKDMTMMSGALQGRGGSRL